MIAADFEALSHQVQKQIGMSEYHVPVLVGYSSGATVVYATLVQSPPGTFAGALSLGFCPDQDFAGAALCPGAGLHYTRERAARAGVRARHDPAAAVDRAAGRRRTRSAARTRPMSLPRRWRAAQVVQLPLRRSRLRGRAQLDAAVSRRLRAPRRARAPAAGSDPPDISDLPVQEVHASGASRRSSRCCSPVTAAGPGSTRSWPRASPPRGVPTVGLNSLKYFWSERTPEETARDVARVLRHYLAAWHKQRVLLIGYSFGADVLPFVVNRLPPELRERVASVSLLGIDANASFEVRIADWVGERRRRSADPAGGCRARAPAGAVHLRRGRSGLDLPGA